MLASPLALIAAAVAAWLAIGALGLVRPRDLRVVRVLFPAGAAVGIALAAVLISATPSTAQFVATTGT